MRADSKARHNETEQRIAGTITLRNNNYRDNSSQRVIVSFANAGNALRVYVSKEATLVTEERKINNSREKRKVVFRALCTKPLGECLHLSALERAITYVHRFIKPVETAHVIRAQILASTAASCLPIFSRCYGFVNACATETLEI